MALQDIGGELCWPALPSGWSVAPTVFNVGITATTYAAAFVFQAPKTGDISTLGFRTSTLTTGCVIDVRLETVDLATGFPTGTLFATDTNGLTGTVVANTTYEVTLTASASVTKGDLLAVVLRYSSGSTPNFNLFHLGDDSDLNMPYVLRFTTAWADSDVAWVGTIGYSDGSYPFIPSVWPLSSGTLTQNISSSTTPDELGSLIVIPFACRVVGAWIWLDNDADCDVVLYDDADSVLASYSIDDDIWGSNAHDIAEITFSGNVTLAAGDTVRLVCKPTTTTNSVMALASVASAAKMDHFSGGQSVIQTERTNAGAWTDTSTKRAFIGLRIDQLDDGVSTGGGSSVFIG